MKLSTSFSIVLHLFALSDAAVLHRDDSNSNPHRPLRKIRAPSPASEFPEIPYNAIPTGFLGLLHPDRGMGMTTGSGTGLGTGTAASTCKMTETPKPTTTATEKATLATKAYAGLSQSAHQTPLQQYLGEWRPGSTWKPASTSWVAGPFPSFPPELFKSCGKDHGGSAYSTGNEQSKGIAFKPDLMDQFITDSLNKARDKKVVLSYRGLTGWPSTDKSASKDPKGTDCTVTNSKHMTAYVDIQYDFDGQHGANCRPPANNQELTSLDMNAKHDQIRSIFNDVLKACPAESDGWSFGGSLWLNCYVFRVGVNWNGDGDVKKGGC